MLEDIGIVRMGHQRTSRMRTLHFIIPLDDLPEQQDSPCSAFLGIATNCTWSVARFV